MNPTNKNKPWKIKRKKYTKENLQSALDAVKKGMSKKLASKTFNVPRGTIQSRLRKPCQDLPGPRPILSDKEEIILVQWVIDCCKKGFPKRKSDLQLAVANFIQKAGRDNPFKDDIPGKKWYDLFMRRHPELGERTAEAVTSASANVSEKDIKEWFQKIEVYLKENKYFDILQEPSRVFNGDESNFQLCPKSGKVISLRGERDVYEVDHAAAKTALTVLFTFGANGVVTPPMVVFPNKRLPKDLSGSIPSEWGIGLSDSGWMKAEVFHDYIENVFHPYLIKKKVTFPVILFVDGHKTHLSLEVSELCSKLQIILIALYPNATRILQPADVSAFRPLKVAWKESVLKWRRDHPLETLTKRNFVPILKEALEVGVKESTIINGFRTTGLCPWNSEAINYKKCLGKESKNDAEGKENTSKLQENINKDIVMTAETLKKIVGQAKFTYLQKAPLESLTETENILKKICCYFKNHQTDATQSQESVSEVDNYEADEFHPIAKLPVILVDDFPEEMRIINTEIMIEPSTTNTQDYLGSDQLIYIDSQQHLLTPVKLQDVSVTNKTPERKGVRNVERSSFVLTSAEWQKTEKVKLKAKQLKEEEQETRKKNRLLKQQEKNKAKAETIRNKSNKKVKGAQSNKIQKSKTKKIQETKKQDSQQIKRKIRNDSLSSDDLSTIQQDVEVITHNVLIHDNNIPSILPENEHPSDIKKIKAEEEPKFPPKKKIKILSDIKLNSPNISKTSQVGQKNDKLIGDPLDKLINKSNKKCYTVQELENIFSEID